MSPDQRHQADARAQQRKVIARYTDTDKHAVANLTAARAILEDPDKHGGEPAALVIWARAIVRRHRETEARVSELHGMIAAGLQRARK